MKKYIITFIILVILLSGILFFLNPKGIYKLSEKTALYITHQAIPDGTISLKARDCGTCHVEIYQEWQTSLHAKAFLDPFFTAYLKKTKVIPPVLSVIHHWKINRPLFYHRNQACIMI